MSESTLAIDHAWSVVKGDPDKIEKIDPITAGFALAALGTGAYNAGARVRSPISNSALRNPFYMTDKATIADPTGLLYSEGIDDPTRSQRAVAFGTQAIPIGAAGKLLNYGRGGLRNLRAADKAAGASYRARQLASAQRADDAATGHIRNLEQSRRATHRGGSAARATNAEVDEAYRIAEDSAMQLRAAQQAQGVRAARQTGKSKLGRAGAIAGVGGLGLGLGLRAGEFVGDQLGNLFGGGQGSQQQLESGFGQGQQYDAFGSGGLGVNDISNVQGNAVADRQIWNPQGYEGQQRVEDFEGTGTAGGGEFGGFGIGKGDIMFVNRTGNEIKKQVERMMYKAKCPECGKEDCLGKMHCGTMKADDKKDKKPAHGMVIVIGSKAGPGPSKDGKREKLDSEKKEE